jgi:hypothetical protein
MMPIRWASGPEYKREESIIASRFGSSLLDVSVLRQPHELQECIPEKAEHALVKWSHSPVVVQFEFLAP